jgi:hypothetical protein
MQVPVSPVLLAADGAISVVQQKLQRQGAHIGIWHALIFTVQARAPAMAAAYFPVSISISYSFVFFLCF